MRWTSCMHHCLEIVVTEKSDGHQSEKNDRHVIGGRRAQTTTSFYSKPQGDRTHDYIHSKMLGRYVRLQGPPNKTT